MSQVQATLFRFYSTFGILFLALFLVLTLFYHPLKKYVAETKQVTAMVANARVLSYQTPDFELLAKDIDKGHVFTPQEMQTYDTGQHYLSFFTTGSQLYPDNFEMSYMQGVCLLWAGNFPSAEKALKKSLALEPVFFWGYYNLGLLYLKYGQIDGAIVLFSRAKLIPEEATLKILHEYQAFYIIWQYIPDPLNHLYEHLKQAEKRVDYFLTVAHSLKDRPGANAHFNPNQWNPVFF